MKILVYGINAMPELTGIGKYTGEMVEWLAAQSVMRCGLLPHRLTTRSGRWARLHRRATNEKRGPPRCGAARCTCQLSTLKRLLHLGNFCRQQFFPVDGATSLEAGSHYRRGANAVLHATPASLARVSCCIFRITKWTPCWAALPEEGGKWHSWQRRSNVADCICFDNVSTISRSMVRIKPSKRRGGKRHLLPQLVGNCPFSACRRGRC